MDRIPLRHPYPAGSGFMPKTMTTRISDYVAFICDGGGLARISIRSCYGFSGPTLQGPSRNLPFWLEERRTRPTTTTTFCLTPNGVVGQAAERTTLLRSLLTLDPRHADTLISWAMRLAISACGQVATIAATGTRRPPSSLVVDHFRHRESDPKTKSNCFPIAPFAMTKRRCGLRPRQRIPSTRGSGLASGRPPFSK